MALDLNDVNLLEMRKSERKQLAVRLRAATEVDMEALSQKIENTLLTFSNVFPENEEQVYLFGIAIKSLLESLNGARSIRSFREHPDREIKIVFGGGLLGLSFKETLAQLESDRKVRRAEHRKKTLERKTKFIETNMSLVEDIKELVAGIVPSQTPFNK